MKKLIMTDLDCTLLLMDQDKYIHIYLNQVAKLFYEHGFDGKEVAKATMQASYMMAKNDGTKTNAQAFEEAFVELVPQGRQALEIFPQVYAQYYDPIKQITQANPYATQIVNLMREKAQNIVVATQPMFPIEAVEKRLSWTALDASMFDYVTTYDNSTFCKPSTGYYKEIMDKFGATPEETVMIGNDVNEDILPCKSLGVETFLVEDGLINIHNHDISNINKGNYPDLIKYLNTL